MTILRRVASALACAMLLPLVLAACSMFGPTNVIRVLAGSEVKDLEPILADMERETGVHFEFEYIGTLDGTEALLAAGDKHDWDATWFPSNHYLELFPEGEALITKSESVMRSDVVLGIKRESAQRLGWTDKQPTWDEVVAAAESGKLTYGMTSPISSNSGFTTLVQMSTALSGTGTVLEPGDIDKVAPRLQAFATGQNLASGSSGWLIEKYLQDTSVVDGVFNYESVLRGLDQQLTIVHPSDGTIASDYPLSLLAGADEKVTENFNKALDYLLSDKVQERIANDTHRQTNFASPDAASRGVYALPFPNKLETVQKLLETWLSEVKKPSNMVFAIDTSGSMSKDDRMTQLRSALGVLSGQDANSGTASLLRLQPRESITYLEFSGYIKSDEQFSIPTDRKAYDETLQQIREHGNRLQPGGNTAIYDTVYSAYEEILKNANEDSISSIVLFTDGENTSGMSLDEFKDAYFRLVADHPLAAQIPVYTVVFGESDAAEMKELAELTGGRAFDAKSDSLTSAFREIRGYL